jgi:diguanylate cyclase (GGDEF)-like protein
MQLPQVGMLALEAAVMSLIVLGLFRVRTILGLTPLYIVLGGLQYLETTLSLRVEVMPGVTLYPASIVMFPTTLASVLLIYVKDDAIEARKLVYGLVLANLAAALLSLLIGWHLALPGTIPSNLRPQDFLGSAWISTVGTSVLFIDVIGIILCYEYFAKFFHGLFLPFFLSLFAIVAFDNVIFMAMVHGGQPNVLNLLRFGFAGKAIAALFYSVVFWLYLKYFEPKTAVVGTGDVADVFNQLTYRQKYEQARQRMVRDALTGLFNRGHFDETLPRALAAAKQTGESLSLLIIDVDNFKSINDGLSHMEGDRALQLIGRTLSGQSRAADVPCRYGGDEFVILLSRANAAAAVDFAERFRETLLERCRTAVPLYPWGLVSTTIGIATYPADQEVNSPEDLIRVADRRLYEGKRAGRDRIVGRDNHPEHSRI